MPDEPKKKWYAHDRVQGFGVFCIGIAMLFNSATRPQAGAVIAAGVGWMTAGTKNAIVRKITRGNTAPVP